MQGVRRPQKFCSGVLSSSALAPIVTVKNAVGGGSRIGRNRCFVSLCVHGNKTPCSGSLIKSKIFCGEVDRRLDADAVEIRR
jgi:hypothetical protein